MTGWQVQVPHECFECHTDAERFVAVGLDGRSSWGLGQEAQADIWAKLHADGGWRHWENVENACAELEQMGVASAQEVFKRHKDTDGPSFDGTGISAVVVIGTQKTLDIALLGFYEACLIRGRTSPRFAKPTPHPHIQEKIDASQAQGPNVATALHWVCPNPLFADLEHARPLEICARWSVQLGDEVIIANRHLFLGLDIAPPHLIHIQDTTLDWAPWLRQQSRYGTIRKPGRYLHLKLDP